VGAEKLSIGEVDNISLAIDSASGTPYVAYTDDAVTNRPTVMKFNGTAWEVVGTASFSGSMANYISLAVVNGTPYVAYEDNNTSSQSVTVSKFDGTNWVTVEIMGFSGSNASFISLAIGHHGQLYVGYKDAGTTNSGISVSTFNGTNWIPLGPAGFSVGAVTSVSLAVDNNDNLYAAFSDNGLANALSASVMKYNTATSSWVQVGLPGFTTTEADYLSLKVNAAGTPYIAYSDYASGGKASVMQYNGTAWMQMGSADFTSGSAEYVSMSIDQTGSPYVGYVDDGNSRSASVKKYSFAAGINDVNDAAMIAVYPNPTSGTFTVKTSTSGAYIVSIFNVLGEKLRDFSMTGTQQTFNISDLASGIYEVQVRDGKQIQRTMKLVKG
jgi:hypothetical protein